MFDFTCKICGKSVQAENPSAGDILCPACSPATSIATAEHAAIAKIVTTPSDGAFREGEPPLSPKPYLPAVPTSVFFSWTSLIIAFVVVLTAIGLSIPYVQKWRAANARTQSINNLKRIGLAFHEFHDVNKRLPFNGTIDAQPGDATSGSWAFQILPYLDEGAFFNRPGRRTAVPIYMCPGRGRPIVSATGAWTDYSINPWINDPNGVVNAADCRRTLVSITDGSSNTTFLGHGNIDPDLHSTNGPIAQSTDIFKGGDPGMARRSTTNRADKAGDAALNWGGPFSEGCLFCMGDATVRPFSYSSYSGGEIKGGVAPAWAAGTTSGLGAFLTPSGGAAEGWSGPHEH